MASMNCLVADNLSDDVLLMNGVTGKVLRRFDLSQGSVVPSTYPIAIAGQSLGKPGLCRIVERFRRWQSST